MNVTDSRISIVIAEGTMVTDNVDDELTVKALATLAFCALLITFEGNMLSKNDASENPELVLRPWDVLCLEICCAGHVFTTLPSCTSS